MAEIVWKTEDELRHELAYIEMSHDVPELRRLIRWGKALPIERRVVERVDEIRFLLDLD